MVEPTHNTEALVASVCKRLLALHPPNLVVAYSGGVDSTLLLYLAYLCTVDNPQVHLRALHIDHGDAFETGVDYQDHCIQFCERYGIERTVVPVQIKKQGGKSLEQSARECRYQVFEQHMTTDEWLLLAHHLDDQMETLLLRLARAAGIRGLLGIPQQRSIGAGQLLRPLLHIERREIEAMAKQLQLEWIEDPSNVDCHFDRSYIREKVLPPLKQRWPDLAQSWNNSVNLLGKQYKALEWLCLQKLQVIMRSPGVVSKSALQALPSEVQQQLLVTWCLQFGLTPPGAVACAKIIEQLLSTDCPPSAIIPFAQFDGSKKVSVRCYRDGIYLLCEHNPPLEMAKQYRWNPRQPLALPHGLLKTRNVLGQGLRVPEADWCVTFRQHIDISGLQPVGKIHTVTLKNLLQENAIPPWSRDSLPMICADDVLLAVADIAIAASAVAASDEQGLVIEWYPDNNLLESTPS